MRFGIRSWRRSSCTPICDHAESMRLRRRTRPLYCATNTMAIRTTITMMITAAMSYLPSCENSDPPLYGPDPPFRGSLAYNLRPQALHSLPGRFDESIVQRAGRAREHGDAPTVAGADRRAHVERS